jgi:AAA domain/DnaB-like helicase N terminal domain
MASARKSQQQDNWQEPNIPYNDEAARWVLGAILADRTMFAQFATWLRASDFYPGDRAIWEAAEAIVAEGGTPEEVAVIQWLERHGRLAEAGGRVRITPLSTGVPPSYPHAAEGWVKTLLQDAESRTQWDLSFAYGQASQRPLDAQARTDIVRHHARLDDIQRRLRGEGEATPTYEPLGVSMADVQTEDFRWMWHGRIALGKITMVDGDPGLGKSLVTLDLVARVAMGHAMPDGSPGLDAPASVVIVCGEDGLADTVKPRLLAAGASPEALRRVQAVNLVPKLHEDGAISERIISLLEDLPKLEATITHIGARAMVIDPITAYLGGGTDMYKDSDLRRVLTPLALMAERAGVAVLAVRHLNKSTSTPALHRGLGGVGFIGVARLGLLFAPNPDADGEVLVSRHKGNIGAPPPTLAYRIIQVGEAENMPRVSWDGERKTTAGDALAAQTGGTDSDSRSATDEAVEWLRDYLGDGPHPATEIVDAAVADRVISDAKHDKPLRIARQRLGIKPYREGGAADRGRWMWRYDATPPNGGQHSENDATREPVKPEFNGTTAKMPTTDETGHLSTENPPKMPSDTKSGQHSADAVEFGDDGVLRPSFSPKMPSIREKGNFTPTACIHPAHAVRTLVSGRTVCGHCGTDVAPVGA